MRAAREEGSRSGLLVRAENRAVRAGRLTGLIARVVKGPVNGRDSVGRVSTGLVKTAAASGRSVIARSVSNAKAAIALERGQSSLASVRSLENEPRNAAHFPATGNSLENAPGSVVHSRVTGRVLIAMLGLVGAKRLRAAEGSFATEVHGKKTAGRNVLRNENSDRAAKGLENSSGRIALARRVFAKRAARLKAARRVSIAGRAEDRQAAAKALDRVLVLQAGLAGQADRRAEAVAGLGQDREVFAIVPAVVRDAMIVANQGAQNG
jgi:hypothetical protein